MVIKPEDIQSLERVLPIGYNIGDRWSKKGQRFTVFERKAIHIAVNFLYSLGYPMPLIGRLLNVSKSGCTSLCTVEMRNLSGKWTEKKQRSLSIMATKLYEDGLKYKEIKLLIESAAGATVAIGTIEKLISKNIDLSRAEKTSWAIPAMASLMRRGYLRKEIDVLLKLPFGSTTRMVHSYSPKLKKIYASKQALRVELGKYKQHA